MHSEGDSLRAIARALNEKDLPTARGGKWYASTVAYILNNPVYKGVLGYSGISSERSDLALVV